MKNKKLLLSSLFASMVLTACGGGGGSDSSATAAAANPTPTTPTTPTVPATTGESLPSLSSPQAGSTAATGNGVLGIWSTSSSGSKTLAFVDPQSNISYATSLGGFVTSEFFGVVNAAASAWTLTSGDEYIANTYYPTTAGSGTYTNNQTFSGSYTANSSTVNLAWSYDAANALAVSQSSVTGTWAQTNVSLTVANDGTVTGTLSTCPVTGTLVLATPASSQNLYTLTFSATGTLPGTCTMTAGKTYTGDAAITFVPITGSTLYQRALYYVVRTADKTGVAYGQPQKQ